MTFVNTKYKKRKMEAIANFLFESDDESDENNTSGLSIFEDESTDSSLLNDENTGAHQRVHDFVEVIQSYNDLDFKRHFRLHRSTSQGLIDRYKLLERFSRTPRRGLPKISPELDMYIFLWYMANTNTFREISNLFGMSISTAWNAVRRVTEWLITIGHEYVKWPTENEALQNAALMEAKTKIPGILGCIDGSHIRIKAPIVNKESYFNRKRYYSIAIQAVVDPNKKFINIFCGEPGSLHDSRILRRSDLYSEACDDMNTLFKNNTFLLGDSAYPSLDWLVPPFKDNGTLTTAQRSFNSLHSSGRVIVEHSFGLLKTHFRRLLHFTEQRKINFVVNLVVCGCILHNICTDNNDEFDGVYEPENLPTVDNNQGIVNGNRRERLLEDMINRHIIRT